MRDHRHGRSFLTEIAVIVFHRSKPRRFSDELNDVIMIGMRIVRLMRQELFSVSIGAKL